MKDSWNRRYGYAPAGINNPSVRACNDCGALVLHTNKHDEFHETLTETDRLAGMNRVLASNPTFMPTPEHALRVSSEPEPQTDIPLGEVIDKLFFTHKTDPFNPDGSVPVPEYTGGATWAQRISRALGVQLGHPVLTCDEAVERIENLMDLANE